jgi:hypothetical protein
MSNNELRCTPAVIFEWLPAPTTFYSACFLVTPVRKRKDDMQQSNEQRKNGEAMQSKSAWQRRQKQQQRKQATIIQWFRKTLTIG